MAQTDEERQASNVDALTAPEEATPGAAVLRRRRPVLVAILDSGATIHAISGPQFLSNTRRLNYPKAIRVADGGTVFAYAVGEIDTERIKLKNVYLVPDLKVNLVSIRELTKAGITVTFCNDRVELKKGMELVGEAIAEGDNSLYKLTYLRETGFGDPAAPSGSERLMMTAVNGPTDADFLMPKKYFAADYFAVHYGKKKFNELMSGFNSLDDTVKPEYIAADSTLLSKFYLDYGYEEFNELMSKFKSLYKTGGGVIKTHFGPDPLIA